MAGGKKFETLKVSTFAHELVRDLEEATMAVAVIDPLQDPDGYGAAYSGLSRHRRILYNYLEKLEVIGARESSVIEIHRRSITHLRF